MNAAPLIAIAAFAAAGLPGAAAAETVREICVANRTVMTATVFRRVPAGAKNAFTANLERLGVVPAGKSVCLKPDPRLGEKDQLVVGASRPNHAVCPTSGEAVKSGVLRVDYAGRGRCRPTEAG